MDQSEREAIRDAAWSHTETVIDEARARWGTLTRLDPLPVDPLRDGAAFPESLEAFHGNFYPYAAAAVVTDDAGRLLCVYSPARDEWETPGGAGEPGERPAETARRETREETGIECEITGVCFVQVMTIDLGPPERLPIPVVSFTAGRTGGTALTDAEIEAHDEVTDLEWFTPDAVPTGLRNYEQKHAHLQMLTDTLTARTGFGIVIYDLPGRSTPASGPVPSTATRAEHGV